MIKRNFELPTGKKITLIYFGGLQSPAGYLHYKRTPTSTNSKILAALRITYNFQLENRMIPSLYAELNSTDQNFDAIAIVPSSKEDAAPLFHFITDRLVVSDISDRFQKDPTFKSMLNSGKIDSVREAITYQERSIEDGINSLLLIDESIGTGQTVAVMIEKLIEAGMPEDCEITVVVLLKVKQ